MGVGFKRICRYENFNDSHALLTINLRDDNYYIVSIYFSYGINDALSHHDYALKLSEFHRLEEYEIDNNWMSFMSVSYDLILNFISKLLDIDKNELILRLF